MFPSSSVSQGMVEGGTMSLKPSSTPTVYKALNSAAVDALSVSELRAGMQQFLRSSGALGSLKTQLRSVIVSELLKRQGPSPRLAGPTPPVEERNEENVNQENDAWTERLVDALVENHLRHTGRSFSLAIFSTEADLSFGAAGDDALAGLLHLNDCASSVRSHRGSSLLQNVVESHLRHVGDVEGCSPAYTVGTQTDDGLNPSVLSSPIPLEQRLAAVDAKYALCFSRLGHSTREEVDRRLAAYREELQVQMESAYQQRVRVFEREELNAARRTAEEHYAVLLEHKLAEARAVATAAAEAAAAERRRLAEARAAVEAAGATAVAATAGLRRELDEALAAAEAAQRRERAAREETRGFAIRLQQVEELSAVRLAEGDAARGREWRRVEDLRRLQAEHAAELLLKDEEIARLRLRLKTLIAAHGAGDMDTLSEGLARVAEIEKRVAGNTHHAPQVDQHHRERMWQSAWYATVPARTTVEGRMTPPRDTTYNEKTPSVLPIPQIPGKERKDDLILKDSLPDSGPTAQVGVNVAESVPPASSSLDTAGEVPSAVEDVTQRSAELEYEKESKSESSGKRSNNDHMKGVSLGNFKNDTPSSPVLSEVDSKEKNVSREKDKTSVQSVASSSSPSSTSTSIVPAAPSSPSVQSSTSLLRSEREKNTVTTAAAAGVAASLFVQQEVLHHEEAQARDIIVQEEDTFRRGITWAAKSQYNILLQRERAENEDPSNKDVHGVSALGSYMSSVHQQQLPRGGIDTVFSEDDSNNSNDILLTRRESSDESF